MDEGDGDGTGGPQTPTPPQSPEFAASPTYDPSSPVDSPGDAPSNNNCQQGQGQGEGSVEQQQQQQEQQDEWQAVQDDEGRTYYYNSITGESSWEAPPGFDADAAASSAEQQGGGEDQQQADFGAASGGEEQRWTGYKDDEGRTYYYNEISGETQWERPAAGPGVVVVDEEDMEAEAAAAAQQEGEQEDTTAADEGLEEGEENDDNIKRRSATPLEGDEGVGEDVAMMEEEQKKEEEEEEEDPKQVALEKAEEALTRPDAVLEQDCLDNVAELVEQLGPSTGGPKAMQALVTSHHGLTAVCGLLGLWISDLRTTLSAATGETPTKVVAAKASSTKAATTPSNGNAPDQVRSIAEGIVSRFAREHFSVAKGDNILNLSKAEAAFLEEMIENKRWRRLLIDLSATHKDSALLTYCLKSISKRGHHREIAKRINQSDYFGVFNSMLTSELEFLGMIALGEGSADESPDNMDGVISDLRRTCTSTSYTYLYSREVLRELTIRARAAEKAKDGPAAVAIARAIRRWTRLSEELEAAMVLPDTNDTSASVIVRKRRLDIALVTSDLHQRQRQRLAPSQNQDDEMAKMAAKKNTVRDNLDTAVEKLIRKYAMGLVIDNETAEALLRASYGSDKLLIGDVLNEHPTSLTALMSYLFKPGRMRVRSLELRHRCAKLIALASLSASESLAKSSSGDVAAVERDVDVDELTKVVLRGSQLCEQIETMVTFTVVDEVINKEGSSVGRELSSLCIKNPAVAQGALLWASERGSGSEFVDSAAYPTLAPSILSLARIISIHHPLSRQSVQNIAFIFLKHSPPELSFQKTQALKEQSLRLLLWLSVQGEAVRVFYAVISAGLGSALMRYFASGLLQIIRPPVSLPLVRSLGALLTSKPCVDALRSSHFEASNKALLTKLLGSFKEACAPGGNLASSVTANDKALVANLVSLYS